MATLKHIPISLAVDEVPTRRTIRDIIGSFFPLEWLLVDPEDLKMTYRTEFTNINCIVERSMAGSGINLEPLKVFIKFFSASGVNIDIFKDLVPRKDQEAVLCHDYSLTGLGAKVYGLFKTEDGTMGRIDEFLDARNLEPEDVEDEAIRTDIAKAMASFHTLSTLLPKSSVAVYYDAIARGLQKYHRMEKLKSLGGEAGISIDNLIDYDFASRVKVITDAMEATAAKPGWCIHDVQFMNIMVKTRPQPGESRVVLIDFELVMRNYRGFDIGGHFMQKMFRWFDKESKIADCRKYDDMEKRDFCDHYAKEWNRVTGDSDTTDQVLLESDYGYMLAIAFDIHNMLWYMNETHDKDPLNLDGLNKLYEEFAAQYRRLALAEPGI